MISQDIEDRAKALRVDLDPFLDAVLSKVADFVLLLTAPPLPIAFNLALGTYPLSIILRGPNGLN